MKKELIDIANQIIELEKQAQDNSVQCIMEQMSHLIENLSFEDMVEIDDYIQENQLLTK